MLCLITNLSFPRIKSGTDSACWHHINKLLHTHSHLVSMMQKMWITQPHIFTNILWKKLTSVVWKHFTDAQRDKEKVPRDIWFTHLRDVIQRYVNYSGPQMFPWLQIKIKKLNWATNNARLGGRGEGAQPLNWPVHGQWNSGLGSGETHQNVQGAGPS